MGLFGPNKIQCRAGVWTKIIFNFGRGYSQEFHVTFTIDDGSEVCGDYIEKRYLWILPQAPIQGEVEKEMVFRREWINGIYSVHVQLKKNGMAIIQ